MRVLQKFVAKWSQKRMCTFHQLSEIQTEQGEDSVTVQASKCGWAKGQAEMFRLLNRLTSSHQCYHKLKRTEQCLCSTFLTCQAITFQTCHTDQPETQEVLWVVLESVTVHQSLTLTSRSFPVFQGHPKFLGPQRPK